MRSATNMHDKKTMWVRIEENGPPASVDFVELPYLTLREMQWALIEGNRNLGLERFVLLTRRARRDRYHIEEWSGDGRHHLRSIFLQHA